MALTGKNDTEKIWNFLSGKGFNDYAVAGIMGNLYAESLLKPKNLQDTYEKKLGYTDSSYTTAVDNGTYTKFSSDSAGYGLCQWTYKTRKANLQSYAKSKGKSIGDLEMQLEFLYKELTEDYTEAYSILKSATSVLEASNAILLKFEKPANQGTTVQKKRASYGENYYAQYANISSGTTATAETETTDDTTTEEATITNGIDPATSYSSSCSGNYKTTVKVNMRSGAGTSKEIVCVIPKSTIVKCYGYYNTLNGVKWYYVTYDGKNGYVCSSYLKKA